MRSAGVCELVGACSGGCSDASKAIMLMFLLFMQARGPHQPAPPVIAADAMRQPLRDAGLATTANSALRTAPRTLSAGRVTTRARAAASASKVMSASKASGGGRCGRTTSNVVVGRGYLYNTQSDGGSGTLPGSVVMSSENSVCSMFFNRF